MGHFVASQLHEVTGEPLLPAELELLDAADVLIVEAQRNYKEVLRSGDEATISRCRREVTVAFEWAALLTCDVMAGKLRGGGAPHAGGQKSTGEGRASAATAQLAAPREQ